MLFIKSTSPALGNTTLVPAASSSSGWVPTPRGGTMNPQDPFAPSPFISETTLPAEVVIHHSQMGTTGRMRELEVLCKRHSSQGSETTKPASEPLKMSWKQYNNQETQNKGFLLVCLKESLLPTYADLGRLGKSGNRNKSTKMWCCWAKYPLKDAVQHLCLHLETNHLTEPCSSVPSVTHMGLLL